MQEYHQPYIPVYCTISFFKMYGIILSSQKLYKRPWTFTWLIRLQAFHYFSDCQLCLKCDVARKMCAFKHSSCLVRVHLASHSSASSTAENCKSVPNEGCSRMWVSPSASAHKSRIAHNITFEATLETVHRRWIRLKTVEKLLIYSPAESTHIIPFDEAVFAVQASLSTFEEVPHFATGRSCCAPLHVQMIDNLE